MVLLFNHPIENKTCSPKREIDIDIILHNHNIIDPDLLTEPYIALPVTEIAGDFTHPQHNRSIKDLTSGLLKSVKLYT